LFWLSLRHTLVFVAASVVLEVVIGLAIALVISDERVWLSRLTRVLILIPWAVPPVVNGLLWSFIVNAQFGYLNRVLYKLGVITDYVHWIGHHRARACPPRSARRRLWTAPLRGRACASSRCLSSVPWWPSP